jgi:SH3-like domain-containing protein
MKLSKINLVMMSAILTIFSFAMASALFGSVDAQENRTSIRGSDLEIPRFVSLKATRVNMRTGAGEKYPILWEYQRKGLPLKVVGEFEVWRKVIDHDGNEGWMHVRTLSVKRMAVITDTTVTVHRRADSEAPIVAIAEKGAIAALEVCRPSWCKIKTAEVTGWLDRKSIWGLLENEVFE